MANLKQDMQLALSMGRNRFITSWDKFIMLVADYFFRDHFPNVLHKDSTSPPNLNGLILALRRREGFSMGKLLPNGACMRYDGMELGLQTEFRITRGRDGQVELDNMFFSIGNVPKDRIYRAIPLTGDESELAECIEEFFTNDVPALLREAKLVYTENMTRLRITEVIASTMTGRLTQVLKESGFREDEYSIRVLMPKMFIKVLGRRHEIRITENSYREKLPVLERRIREFGESRARNLSIGSTT